MSLDRAERRSFLADVVIEHGPRDVLGRLFLAADTALRERGVFLSLGDYDELKAINKANADSWAPLLPIFDPDVSDIDQENGFTLIGRSSTGVPIVTYAARFRPLGETTMKQDIESLRLFYRDPEKSAAEGESITCTAPIAERTRGDMSFFGAAWFHPSIRKRDIHNVSRPIMRALQVTRWKPSVLYSFMADGLIAKGKVDEGRLHLDMELQMVNTPVKRGGIIRAGIVWASLEEQLEHLESYFALMSSPVDAQVDRRVVNGPAE